MTAKDLFDTTFSPAEVKEVVEKNRDLFRQIVRSYEKKFFGAENVVDVVRTFDSLMLELEDTPIKYF